MKRVCPRCEALSPERASFCVACGYKLVLPPLNELRRQAEQQRLRRRRHRKWRSCPYCGVRCRGDACAAHHDLLKLDRRG